MFDTARDIMLLLMIMIVSSVKLCRVQPDQPEVEPVVSFRHLDEIFCLRDELKSENNVYIPNPTLLSNIEAARRELEFIHRFSNNRGFVLREISGKLFEDQRILKTINLRDLFDETMALCSVKRDPSEYSVADANFNFLRELKLFWNQLSGTKPQAMPEDPEPRPISAIPILLVESFPGGTRVIKNPDLRDEANACLHEHKLNTLNTDELSIFKRANSLRDPRVRFIEISDRDARSELHHIKYPVFMGKSQPGWESEAIAYLSKLAKEGKVLNVNGVAVQAV